MSSPIPFEEGEGKEKEGKEKEGKEKEAKEEDRKEQWECKMCKTKNNKKLFCEKCLYIPFDLLVSADKIENTIIIDEWKCKNCNTVNTKIFCSYCLILVDKFMDKIKHMQHDSENTTSTSPTPYGITEMETQNKEEEEDEYEDED